MGVKNFFRIVPLQTHNSCPHFQQVDFNKNLKFSYDITLWSLERRFDKFDYQIEEGIERYHPHFQVSYD